MSALNYMSILNESRNCVVLHAEEKLGRKLTESELEAVNAIPTCSLCESWSSDFMKNSKEHAAMSISALVHKHKSKM